VPNLKDVIGITETWCENSHDGKTTVDGYSFRRRGREEEEMELHFM